MLPRFRLSPKHVIARGEAPWQSRNFFAQILWFFASIYGIPTPVCALARNDVEFFCPVFSYTTSVHFLGNPVGSSRGLSHFCSQMTPSQRPIL